ncbi:MAG: hypothetical protein LBK06_03215 [Planctomycetaceae bacterium]|nr:hypothetical protein [Planctomycetaceae bacterium]
MSFVSLISLKKIGDFSLSDYADYRGLITGISIEIGQVTFLPIIMIMPN